MLDFLRHNKLFALALVLSIMALSSCEGAAVEELLKGKVDLTLSSATEIVVKSESEFDHYSFKFSGVGEYGSSDYYTYGEVVMPMEWYYGIYTLYAESCTKEEAEVGYGCVRYDGESAQFSIINDYVETVSVVCNVANCKVNVKFDDTMYESFEGFKLKVRSVFAPEEDTEATSEDGDDDMNGVIRELEFDPINQVGFYNLQDSPILLQYTLYILNYDAEEYIESVSGYFVEEEGQPAVVNAADEVTFNVRYTGTPIISPDIKFIVEGVRTPVKNNITLGDYNRGQIVEDE